MYDEYEREAERMYWASMRRKRCEGCGFTFYGRPSHGFCDSCADRRERGEEMPDYYWDNLNRKQKAAPLPLTAAEARQVAEWRAERSVHRQEAKRNREAAQKRLVERQREMQRPPRETRRRPMGQ